MHDYVENHEGAESEAGNAGKKVVIFREKVTAVFAKSHEEYH